MENDYLESLFQGIDIIVSKRLEDVSYDKTIMCKIVDDSNKKNGEYRVTDGSITFIAYSENDLYKKNESVRVLIPQGDYSQQKYIVGKSVNNDSNLPITFSSPMDGIVDVTGNLLSDEISKKQYSLIANGEKEYELIWNKQLTNEYEQLQLNQVYTSIGIKADFKTLLDTKNIVSGNYGLRIDLLVKPTYAEEGVIRQQIEFDASEMIGNPYAFSIYTSQEKVFDITDTNGIVGIALSLYQEKNFIDKFGNNVPVSLTDDIFVTNIELLFGTDLTKIPDDTLTLYSLDENTYSTTSLVTELEKTMGLIWYNKDSENNYLGFKDGIYDPSYDELAYLEMAKIDYRLENQRGREGVPTDLEGLTLAANLQDESTNLNKISNIIGKDIYSTLNKLDKLLSGAPESLRHGLTGENGLEAQCGVAAAAIEENLQAVTTIYTVLLDYGYKKQNFLPLPEDPLFPTKSGVNNDFVYFNNIKATINYFISSVQDFQRNISVAMESPSCSSFKSIVDNYDTQLTELISKIIKLYDPENDKTFYAETGDYVLLQRYLILDESDIHEHQKPDLSEYDNKYCIYWYKYDKDQLNEENTENLLPPGWVRLPQFNNIGIAGPGETKNEKIYCAEKPISGDGLVSYSMDPVIQDQVFKVILFYNHAMYISNELVFTNTDEILDEDAINKKNAIGFEHLANSAKDYPLYSLDNSLTNAADAHKNRQIRCHYYNASGVQEDSRLKGAQVYWYVPKNSTMLEVDNNFLVGHGFTSDYGIINSQEALVGEYIDALTLESLTPIQSLKTELTNNISTIQYDDFGNIVNYYETMVKIEADKQTAEDLYNNGLMGAEDWNAYQSAIREYEYQKYLLEQYEIVLDEYNTHYEKINETTWQIVQLKEETPSPEENTLLEYSKEGFYCYYKLIEDNDDYSSYLDFYYKIKPVYNQSASQNMIICQVKFNDIDAPAQGEELFSFGVSGTSGTKYTFTITPATSQQTTVENLPLRISLTDENNESIKITNEGITESGEGYECKWVIQSLIDESEENKTDKHGIAPQLIDGGITGAIINQNKYGILEATVQAKIISKTDDSSSRIVKLKNYYPVAYSSSLNYYISGPTSIVYNNMGTIDNTSYVNTAYQLFDKATNIPIENVKWSIGYYMTDSSTREIDDEVNAFYENYMPTLDESNILLPAPLYLSDLDCYAIVYAKQGEEILWAQPLIIMQNKYPSTLLNEWDGKFTINEENGTLLATMIGAGKKTANNTFEGVLMGDVAEGTVGDIGFYTNPGIGNQTGVGIYGFHDGEQSFCFNSDGTAFLGKSGGGRIIINGNSGYLASANWFTGKGSPASNPTQNGGQINSQGSIVKESNDGMCINLKDGHIDAYNFKLTSSSIYLDSSGSGAPPGIDGTFFLYIGDNNSYISFGPSDDSDEYSLSIKVANFDLTTPVGGEGEGTATETNNFMESIKNVVGKMGYVNEDTVNQTYIFNKLITKSDGTKAKGIVLTNGELYINATHIGAGVIQSDNWVGQYKLSNGVWYNAASDSLQQALEDGKAIVDFKTTSGMLLDLNKGAFWAKNFLLSADGVTICSNPIELALESSDSNKKLMFSEDGFIIDALEEKKYKKIGASGDVANIIISQGLMIKSNPDDESDNYFKVGFDNKTYPWLSSLIQYYNTSEGYPRVRVEGDDVYIRNTAMVDDGGWKHWYGFYLNGDMSSVLNQSGTLFQVGAIGIAEPTNNYDYLRISQDLELTIKVGPYKIDQNGIHRRKSSGGYETILE